MNLATAMPDRAVDVVIVAYRSAASLTSCLRPLLEDPAVRSVVVVDTSDDPESRRVVNSAGQGVLYLAFDNVGYGRACNWAARLGSAEYVVMMNADLVLERRIGALLPVLGAGVAVAAGHVRTGDVCPSNVKRMSTPLRELQRAFMGSTRTFGVKARSGAQMQRCEQLDGALLALRRDTWIELGGFDESYELYYEDVDLCRRAEVLGGCAVLAGQVGRHEGGASSRQNMAAAYRVRQVSRLRYLRRYHGSVGSVTALVCTSIDALGRSALGGEEGGRARVSAIRDVLRETLSPGSVWLLVTPRTIRLDR
ncbi:MAG: glycosyltransferase [Actinomycetota bacterium]|nr:glycosyltransferase [Actinomycetota bacterium]